MGSEQGFQSGLSWRTILAKRENFRTAFLGFDYWRVAHFGESDVERMLGNSRIAIRNASRQNWPSGMFSR